jgi:ketosteroid isomerase-like protein
MTDIEPRIEELERRLRRVEDEQAIHRTLVRYGFAVDVGDSEATADLYTHDCLIELDFAGGRTFRGRPGAKALVDDETHQSLLPNCAHLIGPLSVVVDGDRAVATGYAMVVKRHGDSFAIWRQGCGRWELVRRGDEWRISHRTSMAVGSAAAQVLLSGGLR